MKLTELQLKSGLSYRIEDEIIIINETEELLVQNKKYSKFYNIIASLYDLSSQLYFGFFGGEKNARNEFLEPLVIRPHDKVLEVSVGTGINIQLLPTQANYYGIDISHEMLRKCRKNLHRSQRTALLFQAEAENLPFRDDLFDCVFHVGGMNYFANKKRAIEEMMRVAKSGSYITIVDETDKFFTNFSWIPLLNNFFKTGAATQPPTHLLPKNVKNVSLNTVVNGNYWRLTFQKM